MATINEQRIQQLIETFSLKADALALEFRYMEVASKYQEIIDIYEENELPSTEFVGWYDKLGEVHLVNHTYPPALEFEQPSPFERSLGGHRFDLVKSFDNMEGRTRDGQQRTSLGYQKKPWRSEKKSWRLQILIWRRPITMEDLHVPEHGKTTPSLGVQKKPSDLRKNLGCHTSFANELEIIAISEGCTEAWRQLRPSLVLPPKALRSGKNSWTPHILI